MSINESSERRPILKVGVLVLTFLLVGFRLNVSMVTGNDIAIFAYDLIFVLVWVYILYHVIKKREFSNYNKLLTAFTVFFGVYFIFLTIFRLISGHSINNSTVLIRPLIWAVGGYLFLNIRKDYLLHSATVVIVIVTCLNLYQIVSLSFFERSIREFYVLSNIMINITVQMVSLLLLYLSYIYKVGLIGKHYKVSRFILLFNLAFTIILLLGSGSRLYFPLFVVMAVLMIVTNKNLLSKKLKQSGIFLLTIFIIFMIIVNFNLFNSSENVYRTCSYIDNKHIDNLVLTDIETSKKQNDIKQESIIEQSEMVILSDETVNLSNNMRTSPDETVNLSNNTRTLLWEETIELISDNVAFGRGDINVNIVFKDESYPGGIRDMTQAPHNFILEVWLSMGVGGLIFFLLIYLYPFFYIITRKNSFATKVNLIILYASFFVPSFVQPLITTKLIITLGFWVCLAFVQYVSINIIDKKR